MGKKSFSEEVTFNPLNIIVRMEYGNFSHTHLNNIMTLVNLFK